MSTRRRRRITVLWAPRALARAAAVMERITADRPEAAERWLDDLVARVDLLATDPDQGRLVPEVGRLEVRELIFGQYRVIYRRDARRVVILTVRHGRRAFDFSELDAK